MSTNENQAKNAGISGATGLISVLIGALGSLGFMLYAGRRNNSRLLLGLFALWVISPFMALVLGYVLSKRWTVFTRATLHGLMLVLAVGSLAIYGYVALMLPTARTTPVFVIVPPASCLLIAIVISVAALRSGKRASQR